MTHLHHKHTKKQN